MLTYHTSFEALGTHISIVITSNDASTQFLPKVLQKEILQFEKQFSRFLPSSELSRFNASAGRWTTASESFIALLQKAKEASLVTNGLFNPFILPALQRSGYVHSFVGKYSQDSVYDYSARAIANAKDIHIQGNTVMIPVSSALDLGGCGKGYIGDSIANKIEENSHIKGYWISLGGDVVAKGVHENGEPIKISVKNEKNNSIDGYITANPSHRIAVATSTALKRKGVYKGREWHHIIDPATAKPAASDIHTATVVHKDLFYADIHATNLIILGSEKVSFYIRKHNISDAMYHSNDTTKAVIIGKHIIQP